MRAATPVKTRHGFLAKQSLPEIAEHIDKQYKRQITPSGLEALAQLSIQGRIALVASAKIAAQKFIAEMEFADR